MALRTTQNYFCAEVSSHPDYVSEQKYQFITDLVSSEDTYFVLSVLSAIK